METCHNSQGHQHCTLADEVADKAVKKVFAILGVNIDEPHEIEEFRMGLRFSQSMRSVTNKGVVAIVIVLMSSAVGAIWVGIKVLASRI